MRRGDAAPGLAIAGVLTLACSVDPEGTGTSFTPDSFGSTSTTTTSGADDSPPADATSSSSSSGGDTTDTSGSGTDSTGGEPINTVECMGSFPLAWQDGSDCMTEQSFQVWQYGYGTAILRQTLCVHPAAPFLYMLFGEEQVLLLDTGSGDITISPTVLGVIDDWLAATGKPSIELLVVNNHNDTVHYGGNFQFESTKFATIVGNTQADIAAYFGIDSWPDQVVEHDLGNRIIDIIPVEGHDPSHIVIYDRRTGMLLTGDNLLPGRIFVNDFPAFVSSIERLVQFTEYRDVCHVLGSHIDMTIMPGIPYAFGEMVHLAEHGLPLTRDHLLELHEAIQAMNPGAPLTEVHDDFIIAPL